jgi:hypothetical protein
MATDDKYRNTSNSCYNFILRGLVIAADDDEYRNTLTSRSNLILRGFVIAADDDEYSNTSNSCSHLILSGLGWIYKAHPPVKCCSTISRELMVVMLGGAASD